MKEQHAACEHVGRGFRGDGRRDFGRSVTRIWAERLEVSDLETDELGRGIVQRPLKQYVGWIERAMGDPRSMGERERFDDRHGHRGYQRQRHALRKRTYQVRERPARGELLHHERDAAGICVHAHARQTRVGEPLEHAGPRHKARELPRLQRELRTQALDQHRGSVAHVACAVDLVGRLRGHEAAQLIGFVEQLARALRAEYCHVMGAASRVVRAESLPPGAASPGLEYR